MNCLTEHTSAPSTMSAIAAYRTVLPVDEHALACLALDLVINNEAQPGFDHVGKSSTDILLLDTKRHAANLATNKGSGGQLGTPKFRNDSALRFLPHRGLE